MKIKQSCKVRQVAGENIILMQGRSGGDMTRVVSLNSTSLFLWDRLKDADFSAADVKALLLEQYEVSDEVAQRDADRWVADLKANGIIEE